MKFLPFILLVFFISCDKKENKKSIELPKEVKSEMYTLETKNFFIDVPEGFAVNEMKVANKYAMKDFIKNDSLQYFLIASDNTTSRNTIDFNSDFINSNLDLKNLNETIYSLYKNKFENETMNISIQKDTIIDDKKINYLVFSTLFNDKPEQTMYVLINENGKVVNLNFKTDDMSNVINKDETNWKIIKSIGLK